MMSRRTVAQSTALGTATVSRVTLADRLRGGKGLPSRLVFHGCEGIGKTSFGAQAPSPFFLLSPSETGLHTLMDQGLLSAIDNLEVKDWLNLLSVIEELRTAQHEYKTLVVDTVDGFEKVCHQHVCETDYQGDWSERGFMGYHRGVKAAALGPWRELLAVLDHLREARRMAIILLAHTGIGNFKNPRGPDYNWYKPNMYDDTWAATKAWADIVLFAHREVEVVESKGDRKPKARGGKSRVMATENDAVADAKNRHNLPEEIDMGTSAKQTWQNFRRALTEAKNENNKQGKEPTDAA